MSMRRLLGSVVLSSCLRIREFDAEGGSHWKGGSWCWGFLLGVDSHWGVITLIWYVQDFGMNDFEIF
jgi:hypothetical protein